ncbi:hypothetical protein BN1708_009667 [Verticillium longisporum]|uniref:Xylanolytic transcriptional activator regulatory domain-containing protein n=1 Tax=Verticillium longisporum TaxID=100787 RepID=A0A0G4KJ96_VERLO|nr:hypothetical protein BN1708_009667 [Verticillium longisporum]
MSPVAHEIEEDDPQQGTTKTGKACEPFGANSDQTVEGAEADRVEPGDSSNCGPRCHGVGKISGTIFSAKDGQASGDHDLYPYASIVATHDAPQSTDSSQLFYGPSSNFAFLQQLHRGILFKTARSLRRGGDVEEGGPGLDLFMQRSIFFGAPQRVKPNASLPSFSDLTRHIPLDQLDHFLDTFKTSHLHIYPFLTSAEINEISRQLHAIDPKPDFPPQKTAIALAVLALGALSSPHTEQAEYLYALAKREAVFFDEAVTLSMIQFSVLLSGYQINMARPNSAYIHLGTACRNAFSMGLHRHITAPSMKAESVQERIATIWCLYFHET